MGLVRIRANTGIEGDGLLLAVDVSNPCRVFLDHRAIRKLHNSIDRDLAISDGSLPNAKSRRSAKKSRAPARANYHVALGAGFANDFGVPFAVFFVGFGVGPNSQS